MASLLQVNSAIQDTHLQIATLGWKCLRQLYWQACHYHASICPMQEAVTGSPQHAAPMRLPLIV